MKFYLASSFALKEYVQLIHDMLVGLGHEVPDVWWNIDGKNIPADDDHAWHALPQVKAIALRHWKSIAACDALILVSHPTESKRFTGANIEVGFAIGRGMPVFSIGVIERSGMYSPVVQCRSNNELLESIAIFSLDKR